MNGVQEVRMSEPKSSVDPVGEATKAQALASDPKASVFVSANAGTGKTKLLTDRVLRLLLADAAPETILCVTYTRAAAAEMRNRIAARLADWAVITTAKLTKDLGSMGISQPSQETIGKARRLFAETLDNDNGPRVETVHSFCQSILRRFPIEAGIAPNASLADDTEQYRLKAMARDNVLRTLDPTINMAVLTLAEQTSEENLDEILNNFVRRAKGLDDPELGRKITSHFTVEYGAKTAAELHADLVQLVLDIDEEGLRATAAALGGSGVSTQMKRAARMDLWLAQNREDRAANIHHLVSALFTSGRPLSPKSLSNKDIRAELPSIMDIQLSAQQRLVPYLAGLAAQRCRSLTEALYRYGAAYHQQYQALKMTRGLLDYDDLIVVTNNLMARSEASQWVAWKLDNGISHLLIDEAQDTSPPQWALLRRLTEEFFEQRPEVKPNELTRTMFAVGDFKQSIYSFQGADPAVMSANRESLGGQARARDIDFRALSLSVSFRSTAPVLGLVNKVIPSLAGIEDFTSHLLAREKAGGFVELWPIIESDQSQQDVPGFAPPPVAISQDASALSAKHLAMKVKSWIGNRMLSTGKVICAGDVLILLSKRGRYFEQVLAALQDQSIPIAGADRMKLEEQIEIQDLLALGDVMLLPEDDLQLATILKSPLFGMNEEQLFALANSRGRMTLHNRLMQHAGADSELGQMADQLISWRGLSDQMSVFAFYSHILMNGGRFALQERLGPSVRESLDHFLTLAQNAGHLSLTEFLQAVRGIGGDVKRELDNNNADEVRVMTIHGAKGLEAPVVILPDMLVSQTKYDPLVTDPKSTMIYFNPGSGLSVDFLENAKEYNKEERRKEENRLLYVALTRAREGLVIGGWKSSARSSKDSNYELIRNAMADMPGVVSHDDGGMALTIHGIEAPEKSEDTDAIPAVLAADETVPAWLFTPAPKDPDLGRPFRPSQPGSDFLPQSLTTNGPGRQAAMAKGTFAHRLFEVLPLLPADARRLAADRMAEVQVAVDAAVAATVIEDVLRVIGDPQLARLFGADSVAEVSVNGFVGKVAVSGQIDRFHVSDNDIILGDFKTGAKPDGAVPSTYAQQMALYAKLLQDIYPMKAIRTLLIWTESSVVQEVTPDERDAAMDAFLALQEKT